MFVLFSCNNSKTMQTLDILVLKAFHLVDHRQTQAYQGTVTVVANIP